MTTNQHTRRHKLLHAALDELAADWIMSRRRNGEDFFTHSITLEDFVKWSDEQSKTPTKIINSIGADHSDLYHVKQKHYRVEWTLKLYPIPTGEAVPPKGAK